MIESNGQLLRTLPRSSDGHLCHPAHRSYHLLRLLIGSLLGGWTGALVLLTLGFLANIEFSNSVLQAFKWAAVAGSIGGIIYGAVFGIVAALLVGIFPPIRRSIHPLSIVRAGFLFAFLWPLFALLSWPTIPAALWLGPILAAVLAILGLVSNPHAELVPHSTLGRALGTAVGPFLIIALLLSIVIPMYNRGIGSPMPRRLIFIALEGVDGSLIRQYMSSAEADRLPDLTKLRNGGALGTVNPTQPSIPARLWADMMTGRQDHGILDTFSTSADLTQPTVWQIIASNGWTVGLFQMLPPHERVEGALFDVAPPGTEEAQHDPRSRLLDEVRSFGSTSRLPSIWNAPYFAMRLARLGVRLDTIDALGREALLESVLPLSPRLIYARRKGLQFRIETDAALALMRGFHTDAVFLRFTSLDPLFMDYWRYANPQEFGPPPADVDAALMAGLARVLPDAAGWLDAFVGKLEPYRDGNTLLCVVSDHGERAVSAPRMRGYELSPEGLLDTTGFSGRILGDTCGEAICFRAMELPQAESPVPNPDIVAGSVVDNSEIAASSADPLHDLEDMLRSASWKTIENPDTSRSLFSIARYDNRVEVSLRPAGDLTPESLVTIGSWTNALKYIVKAGEPRTAIPSGSGVFAMQGPQVRPGSVPNNPSLVDVMPTILHALGMQISEQLTGRSLNELFNPQWLGTNPPKYVPTYAPPRPEEPEAAESAVQEEPIDISGAKPVPPDPNSVESGLAGSRI